MAARYYCDFCKKEVEWNERYEFAFRRIGDDRGHFANLNKEFCQPCFEHFKNLIGLPNDD